MKKSSKFWFDCIFLLKVK